MRLRPEVRNALRKINYKIATSVPLQILAGVGYAFICICKLFFGRPDFNPGLIVGIMDGWASPVMAVADLFNANVEMFSVPHQSSYGLGFLLGVMLALTCIVSIFMEDDDGGGSGGNDVNPPQDPPPLAKKPLPQEQSETSPQPRFDLDNHQN
jgi:hypothetical protein